MPVLRLLFFVSAIAIVLSGGAYLVTRNPAFLRFAWQVARFAAFALLIVGALYVLERYVLAGWGVLL
jgi:hypothetical protein